LEVGEFKCLYARTLTSLEAISDEIHEQRRVRRLTQLRCSTAAVARSVEALSAGGAGELVYHPLMDSTEFLSLSKEEEEEEEEVDEGENIDCSDASVDRNASNLSLSVSTGRLDTSLADKQYNTGSPHHSTADQESGSTVDKQTISTVDRKSISKVERQFSSMLDRQSCSTVTVHPRPSPTVDINEDVFTAVIEDSDSPVCPSILCPLPGIHSLSGGSVGVHNPARQFFLRPSSSREDMLSDRGGGEGEGGGGSETESVSSSFASLVVLDDEQIESMMCETGEYRRFIESMDSESSARYNKLSLPAKLGYLKDYVSFDPIWASEEEDEVVCVSSPDNEVREEGESVGGVHLL